MSRFTIQILYRFRCPPTSWLHASSPSTVSIVSCAALAVSQSMTSCSTDVSLRHTSTMPRVSTVHTLPWPNQPMHQAPLRRLQTTSYHSPETSDWSSEDASSRATTPLQKLITRLYFLQVTQQRTFGQKLSYIISREEYSIGFTPRGRRPTSSGTLHYRPVPSLSPILCLQWTIASSTSTVHSGHMSNEWGGMSI